jgi:Tol biopolymer transport system component
MKRRQHLRKLTGGKSLLALTSVINLLTWAVAAVQAQNSPDLVSHIDARRVWTGPKIDIRENGTRPWAIGAISPDGRFLSFVDWSTGGDLALHDLKTGKDRRLTKTASKNSNVSYAQGIQYAQDSTISRDGRRIAYTWWNNDRSELRVLDLNRGASRTLVTFPDAGHWTAPFDWSPDGKWLAVLDSQDRTARVCLVSVADGLLRVIKSTSYDAAIPKNAFSPDGRYLAFSMKTSSDSEQAIYVQAVNGSDTAPVALPPARNTVLGWSPDGRHLLFSANKSGSNDVWALPIRDGRPSGNPKLVKANMRPQALGLTKTGVLYYSATLSEHDVYVASFDFAANKVISLPIAVEKENPGFNDSPEWSRDGNQLVYVSQRDQIPLLVVRSTKTGQHREIRPDLLKDFFRPLWTPDGAITVDGHDKEGRWGIYRVNPTNGNTTPQLYSGPGRDETALAWSPDGRIVYFTRWLNDGKQTSAVVASNIETGQEQEIVRGTPDAVAVSPDGRSIALTNRSGDYSSLLLVPISGGAQREILRVDRPQDLGFVQWSADGAYLLFVRIDRKPDGAQREFLRIPSSGGLPEKIGFGSEFLVMQGSSLRIHPDGHQIAFHSLNQPKAEIWVLDNLISGLK